VVLVFIVTLSQVGALYSQQIDSLLAIAESDSVSMFKKANAFLMIGSILSVQDPDSSYYYLDKAMSLGEEIDDPFILATGWANKGYRDIIAGSYNESLPKLNNTEKLISQITAETYLKEGFTIDQINRAVKLMNRSVHHLRAIAYQNIHGPSKSIEETMLAIELSEELEDTIYMVLGNYNIGFAHFTSGEYARSKKYAAKSLGLAKKAGSREAQCSAMILQCYILEQEMKYDSLKILAQEAYGLAVDTDWFQNRVEASLLLGNAYYYLDSIAKAEELYLAVKEELINREASKYEAMTNAALGLVKVKLGFNNEAKNYFDKFFAYDKSIDNVITHKRALKEYAALEEGFGNHERALEIYKRYYNIQDSVYSNENRKIAIEFEEKYEGAKKDAELADKEIVIAKQLNQRRLLIGGGTLALLLAGFFWSRSRSANQIRKKQELIDAQKIKELKSEKKILSMNAMIEGQEAERTRIAKDLHDGLGGLLSTVKAHFSNIQSEIQKIEKMDMYNRANELVDEACDEVRRISHNLMPGALRLEGLRAAIMSLGEQMDAAHPFSVRVESIGFETRMEESKEVFVYRIIQEALNNIIKHAEAKQVLIQLSETENEFHFIVEDDGRGFDPLQVQSGLGLRSIQSRVDFLKGSLDMDTKEGVGTTLSFHIAKSDDTSVQNT